MTMSASYRLVPIGQQSPDAVTVGVELAEDGTRKAAVWWESKGDIDADEAEYGDVVEALAAAEAARALHGLAEVVVVLSRPDLWDNQWGYLRLPDIAKEPIGDVRDTDLSSRETYALAAGIEEERDA
ncbi:hypothetical protein [Devosia sp.]|uniref:hypothetical protein n=1 Tax=Devosia sp. TaxID=1871048 RepID=UPI0019DCF29D|nr:hypothetical protein [Devosia sp.]MBE0579527.1 hypothetical protein [Devosia sp.]